MNVLIDLLSLFPQTLEQFYPLEETGYDEPFDEDHNDNEEEETSQITGTLQITETSPV